MSVFKGKNTGTGCMVLFATPFAGVGVFMTVLLGWSAFDFFRMQSWEETPATIINVDMESGDETEQVVAEYEYVYDGQKYAGSRVAINSMSDNLGDFHRRKYRELNSYLKEKKPFRCFVNPSIPSESILYRQLRWELLAFFTLFALVFGGVGFGIMVAAFVANGKMKDEAARKFDHPDEPWLWREDWASGQVEGDNRTTTFALLFFGAIWNLISWPVALLVLPQEVADGNYWVLLICLFPMIGLIIVVLTVTSLLRWRKYGRSRFQLASVPGLVGGPLAGAIVARNLESISDFKQTLSCIRSTSDSDGDQAQETLWQTTRVINKKIPTAELDTLAVPVLFHVPYDCRPTSMSDDSRNITWQLEMKADAPGIDYHAKFEVPVFKTPASSPEYKADDSLIEDYAKPEAADEIYARSQIRRQAQGGQLHIRFGYFRNLGAVFALGVFLVIWTGAIIGMVMMGAPILFPIVFGLIDLFLILAFFDLLFWTSSFEVDARGIRGRFGMLRRLHDFPAEQITGIRLKRGMQSGSTVYYDLRLKRSDARDFVLGKGIKGHADAKHIAEDLHAAMKLADIDVVLDQGGFAGDDEHCDEEE